MTIQDFQDSAMTVDDFTAELRQIKKAVPPQGIDAIYYRQRLAQALVNRIRRVNWSIMARIKVQQIIQDAERFIDD